VKNAASLVKAFLTCLSTMPKSDPVCTDLMDPDAVYPQGKDPDPVYPEWTDPDPEGMYQDLFYLGETDPYRVYIF
jgi:hypothetical protein